MTGSLLQTHRPHPLTPYPLRLVVKPCLNTTSKNCLGGFAADTLTPEEKQTLYTAALQDQQLFNALADEQAFKELLADPDVRRRLLASLEQKSASGAGGSLSWLDWFRRPTGLAIAGGLSAAALAVVLGGRIYQDSLRHAAESTATEEVKPASPPAPMPPVPHPATPQAVEPQTKAKDNSAPAVDREKKDRLIDKPAMQQRSMPPPSKKERASDVARDSLKQRSQQDEVRSQAEAPVAALNKSAEELTSPADQKLAASSAQPVHRAGAQTHTNAGRWTSRCHRHAGTQRSCPVLRRRARPSRYALDGQRARAGHEAPGRVGAASEPA